jgi:hypothetical protein
MRLTARQQAWRDVAAHSDEPAATLFRLLEQPNANERQHDCREHMVGFRWQGRRGHKCGVCLTVIRWVDAAADEDGNEDGSNRDVPPFDTDPRTDDEIKQAVYDRETDDPFEPEGWR